MNKFKKLISKLIKHIKSNPSSNPSSNNTVIIDTLSIICAPITSSIALIPLNIITGVSCLDESGNISRNHKIIAMSNNNIYVQKYYPDEYETK